MAAFATDDIKRAPQPTRKSTGGADPDRNPLMALAEAMSHQNPVAAYSPVVLQGIVRFLDFALMCAAAAIVWWVYLLPHDADAAPYVIATPVLACLAIIVFQALEINHVAAFRTPVYQGFRLSGGLALVVLAALGIVFFLKLEGVYSRVWILGWYALSVTALILERFLVSIVVRRMTRAGRLDRRTVVVGGGPLAEQLLEELSKQENTDLRIFGVFDDRTDTRSPDVVAGYPKLGTVDDLVEFARHTRIDLAIFAMPITAETRLLEMLRKLWVLPIDIRLAAHTNKLRFRPRSYSYIGNVPVHDVFDKPIADWDVVMKSVFDRVVGALCLLLLAPVLLVVALAIKLDSRGPVLFRQKRYGFNNELIEVFKFRSMYTEQSDATAVKLVTKDDPRVTRVGRFIRKTSLDELPQLINVVFKGNLSLVGPRPHAIHAKAADTQYDEVVDGYFARHRVRPGITGWAQVNGWRGETDTPEKLQKRVEHDLFYIENWSILFDIYILAITPFALVKAENAY